MAEQECRDRPSREELVETIGKLNTDIISLLKLVSSNLDFMQRQRKLIEDLTELLVRNGVTTWN